LTTFHNVKLPNSTEDSSAEVMTKSNVIRLNQVTLRNAVFFKQ